MLSLTPSVQSPAAWWRRVPDTVLEDRVTAALLGRVLYPRTDAEISNDVTPVGAYEFDVRRFGASVTGTPADNVDAINKAIAVAPAGAKVIIAELYPIDAGILVSGKSDLEITGGGGLQLVDAASDEIILQPFGTCARLNVHDLTLLGEANDAYNQCGIATFSGQNVSDSLFHDLVVADVNIGISFNAVTGTFTRCKAYNILMANILGTAPGAGYGMHVYATHCQMSNLLVYGANRHSFYQAGGSHNVWSDIKAVNNKTGNGIGSYGGALAIFRSQHIHVTGYTCQGFEDGALAISHETSSSTQCNNIVVENVKIAGRGNVIPAINIGEQAVPGTYETKNVTLRNVEIYEDDAGAHGGYLVYVFNGRFVRFKDVRFVIEHMDTALIGVGLGDDSYIANDADCENNSFDDVVFDITGSTLANFTGFRVCSAICGGTSLQSLFASRYTAGIDLHVFDASVTNATLLTRETLSSSGGFDPGSLTTGTGQTTTLAVVCAALGDYVQVSFSLDLQGITLTGYVSAAGTVSIRFQNGTGGTLDLGAGTLRADVRKAA